MSFSAFKLAEEIRNMGFANQRLFTWWMFENLEKSFGGIDQSNKLKFSLILDSFTLFGRMLWPLWRPQRRATCAGDLLSSPAISCNIASFKISPFTQEPGDPKGEYAWEKNLPIRWLWISHQWINEAEDLNKQWKFPEVLPSNELQMTCNIREVQVAARQDDTPLDWQQASLLHMNKGLLAS